jgi:hypothetical protein
MESIMRESDIRELVRSHFQLAGIDPASIEVRTFPGEIIAIVEVDKEYDRAIMLAEEIDKKIENGFVTVRKISRRAQTRPVGRVESVHDDRISTLIELMSARARASENQPSLRYVTDVAERVNLAISPRHHLIFGRRGVGKTSLLLEAKRILEQDGHYTLWVNIHALRDLDGETAFLTVAARMCDLGIGAFQSGSATSASVRLLKDCRDTIDKVMSEEPIDVRKTSRLVPRIQQAISRFTLESHKSIYLFLDDIHYLSAQDVPKFLDLLHSVTRDNPI